MFAINTRLMGMLIVAGLAGGGAASAMEGDDLFHAISLECPEAGGGTLQLINMNKLGQRDRITIVYEGDLAVRVEAATAEPGNDFESYFASKNPDVEKDADVREFAETVIAKFGVLRRGVCLAPDNERRQYFRMLERTERYLRG